MIPKMTSHELNSILNTANGKLDKVVTDVKNIKSNISKKLKILRYESEFLEHQMSDLKRVHKETVETREPGEDENIFVIPDKKLSDYYEEYGCTFTPKFKNTPVNVFNIITTATGEAFYRDISEVSINEVVREEYKNILKHDGLKEKELFFEEMEGDDPGMNISIVLDKTKTLGNSLFNMIEIDTFLNGSYLIEYIRIFDQDNIENEEIKNTYEEIADINDAGKMRIVLDREYEFNRVDIRIVPKFKTQIDGVNKYPIGLKHIYFYNAKFISNSYAVAVIESDKFIDKINNEYTIVRPDGKTVSQADLDKIEFFLSYSKDLTTGEDIFSSKQEPSKPGSTKSISINVKKIYAKIPLNIIVNTSKDSKLSNQSIIGFTFSISSKIF